jgi:hypothetical protein
MKPIMLCLLLLSACVAAANYRVYKLTWSCLSAEGCERAEQVELLDRARIIDGDDFVAFMSTRDGGFEIAAQLVPSDALPAECSWLYGLRLFATEAEPSRFCRSSGRFELELSIPNQDPSTASKWFVEAREIDP